VASEEHCCSASITRQSRLNLKSKTAFVPKNLSVRSDRKNANAQSLGNDEQYLGY
jgi:hypothetical protein